MNRLVTLLPEHVLRWVVLGLFLVVGWFVVEGFDATTTSLLVLGLYYAVAGTSFNFLFGSLGVFSLAQPVFLAVGGFSGVYLYNTYGLSPWLTVLIAPVLAAIVALPVALAAVRAGGGAVLTALITLILAQAVPPILLGIDALGGAVGLYVNPANGSGEAVMQYQSGTPYARILLVLNVVMIGFWMWWRRSRFGYFSTALHDSPEASAAIGVPNTRLKVVVFVISAMMAAPAGVVYAQYNLLSTPDLYFSAVALFQVIVVALVGGSARPWGAIVGSVLVTYVASTASELSGGTPGVGPLTFAAIFLLMALLLPRGISGTWAAIVERRRGPVAGGPGAVAAASSESAESGPADGERPGQDEVRRSLGQIEDARHSSSTTR
jgi:branched-chain amino acid transport system permease protein